MSLIARVWTSASHVLRTNSATISVIAASTESDCPASTAMVSILSTSMSRRTNSLSRMSNTVPTSRSSTCRTGSHSSDSNDVNRALTDIINRCASCA